MSEVGTDEVKAGDELDACTTPTTGAPTRACTHSRTFAFNSVHARVLNELSGTPEKSRWVKRGVGKDHHE